MTTRISPLLIAALSTMIALAACGSVEDAEPESASFAWGGDALTISMDSGGAIALRPGDVDQIEVTRWFTGDPEEATWELADDELTLATDCGFLTSCEVRYEVVVPDSAAVALRGSNADVSAADFQRPLAIHTENGDIAVEDVAGDLSLHSTSGRQRATGVTSQQVDARADNGAVDLTFVDAPLSLIVTTENGAVSVRLPEGAYAVSLSTDNGAIESSLTEDAESRHAIEVTTENGDITLD